MSHESDGYKNGQAVIRFIDTKTEVTAGFALALLGGVMVAFREIWVAASDKQKQIMDVFANMGCFKIYFALLVFATLVFGLASMICAILAIIARPPRRTGLRQSVLFPFNDESEKAKDYYHQIVTGMTDQQVKEEYEDQILKIGFILLKKIFWHRMSVYCLLLQIVTLAGAVALLLSNIPF